MLLSKHFTGAHEAWKQQRGGLYTDKQDGCHHGDVYEQAEVVLLLSHHPVLRSGNFWNRVQCPRTLAPTLGGRGRSPGKISVVRVTDITLCCVVCVLHKSAWPRDGGRGWVKSSVLCSPSTAPRGRGFVICHPRCVLWFYYLEEVLSGKYVLVEPWKLTTPTHPESEINVSYREVPFSTPELWVPYLPYNVCQAYIMNCWENQMR